ncbi:MAG: hypothetical protein Q9219_005691 [cf. Caloplaca sp. 3 TL-2023]
MAMFAVPGWSVSPDKLRRQEEPETKNVTLGSDGNDQSSLGNKKSKKRKRAHNVNGTEVTKDNIAELWQKYMVDGKSSEQHGKLNTTLDQGQANKKRRKEKHHNPSAVESSGLATTELDVSKNSSEASVNPPSGFRDGKSKYERRKASSLEKAQRLNASTVQPSHSPNITSSAQIAHDHPTAPAPPFTASTTSTLPSAPRPTSKLTPLQTAMRAKLVSARFRHINQTLYTTPSTHALSLFSTNPEAFASYHAGFRAQVASWPQNPVEIFVQEIKERGVASGPKSQKQLWKQEKKQKKKGKKEKQDGAEIPAATTSAGNGLKPDPLPRSSKTGICTIVDLGCGDAALHATLLPQISSLNLDIRSYDLSQGDGPNSNLITVSDITHLPLANDSADVSMFCLALMGTNWVDFVAEAARVVRPGGECWVGEVRSRFLSAKEVDKAKKEKHKKSDKKKKKAGTDEDEEAANGKIEVEEEVIPGKTPKEQGTDVGPFVDVFRRRGFALKGDVDTRNKMFVRMRFVRVRDGITNGDVKERQGSSKFIDKAEEKEIDPNEEAKILKPCLYKTR